MKQRNIWTLTTIALTASLTYACSDNGTVTTDMPVARVFIVSPANGSVVTSPVSVEFGIEGFALAPAGTSEAGTGHHHLLVDTSLPPADQPIPADGQHLHFGKAQTSTLLELEPGDHTLQLLLGDGNHVPHGSALISDPIVITVVADAVE
jgi:hypothetical protein